MMDFVWVDGLRHPVDEEAWDETAATFFGVGYRTRLPVVETIAEPVNFHRVPAQMVASTLGRTFDSAPWDVIETGNSLVGSALEVVGGWPSANAATGIGSDTLAWTAIVPVAPAAHDATYGAGVSLPWTYNSGSPLAGLPSLSRLEEEQAARHLREVGASVGLWWNVSSHLASSTAGVPLVQTGRHSWVYPDRSAGIVSSWAFFNIATTLSAMPEAITADLLSASTAIAFVSETGGITVLDTLDGRPQVADREQVLTLLTTRLGFLS